MANIYGESFGLIERAHERMALTEAHTMVVRTRMHIWTVKQDNGAYTAQRGADAPTPCATLHDVAALILSGDTLCDYTFPA